ncbi:hypothetical protein C0J52_28218 [Blattella germanica]|nr:hypothetical protein C0J52_28218 [Blattella germanica]
MSDLNYDSDDTSSYQQVLRMTTSDYLRLLTAVLDFDSEVFADFWLFSFDWMVHLQNAIGLRDWVHSSSLRKVCTR